MTNKTLYELFYFSKVYGQSEILNELKKLTSKDKMDFMGYWFHKHSTNSNGKKLFELLKVDVFNSSQIYSYLDQLS